MNDEPDLFTDAYARHGDPQTSHDAARKISFTKTERVVYHVLLETGVRMTSLCIARYLQSAAAKRGDSISWSVSPRLVPLETKGAIERCGKMTVMNSNGNPASLTAWRIKPQPVAAQGAMSNVVSKEG